MARIIRWAKRAWVVHSTTDTLDFSVIIMLYLDFKQVEQQLLQSAFSALACQMDLVFWKKLGYIMLEQFCMKYMWGLAGKFLSRNSVYLKKNGIFS